MKINKDIKRVCPHCGKTYTAFPALSRVDNETLICPDCGVREALDCIGVVCVEEQDKILAAIRGCSKQH